MCTRYFENYWLISIIVSQMIANCQILDVFEIFNFLLSVPIYVNWRREKDFSLKLFNIKLLYAGSVISWSSPIGYNFESTFLILICIFSIISYFVKAYFTEEVNFWKFRQQNKEKGNGPLIMCQNTRTENSCITNS